MEIIVMGLILIALVAYTMWLRASLDLANRHVDILLDERMTLEGENAALVNEADRLRKESLYFPPLFTPEEMERASEANVHQRRWRDSLTTEPKPPIDWEK